MENWGTIKTSIVRINIFFLKSISKSFKEKKVIIGIKTKNKVLLVNKKFDRCKKIPELVSSEISQ